jgi:hypothetical protein
VTGPLETRNAVAGHPNVAAVALLAFAVASSVTALAYPLTWTNASAWLLCGAAAGYAASGST